MKNLSTSRLLTFTGIAFALTVAVSALSKSITFYFLTIPIGIVLFIPLLARLIKRLVNEDSRPSRRALLGSIGTLIAGLSCYGTAGAAQYSEGYYVPDIGVGMLRLLGFALTIAGLVLASRSSGD